MKYVQVKFRLFGRKLIKYVFMYFSQTLFENLFGLG